MGQSIINDNLIRFLSIISNKRISMLERQKRACTNVSQYNQLIEKQNEIAHYYQSIEQNLQSGKCFGYSLVHAAMDCIGKIRWWENVLVELNNWDGTEKSLTDMVLIPGASKYTTRRLLFERVLNYIIPTQANAFNAEMENFLLDKMSYRNMLDPNAHISPRFKDNSQQHKSFFEILDENNNILTIQQNSKVSGNFSKDQLRSLLSNERLKDNICIIYSIEHAIRVGFKDNQWILYDANYQHSDPTKIHKSGTQDQIIDEIFKQLQTQAITLDFASFNKNKLFEFSDYEQFIEKNAMSLLQNGGIGIIATNTPEILPKILQNIDYSTLPIEQQSFLAHELLYDIPYLNELIPTFHLFAQSSPNSLTEIFKLASKYNPNIKQRNDIIAALSTSLTKTSSEQYTGLHFIAQYAPDSLDKLFELAVDSPTILHAITQALTTPNKRQITPLSLMASSSNNRTLIKLFKLAQKSTALQEAIFNSIPIKDSLDNVSAFDFILKANDYEIHKSLFLLGISSPKCYEELFKIVNNSPYKNLIISYYNHVLKMQTPPDYTHTLLHQIAVNTPQLLNEMFKEPLFRSEMANIFIEDFYDVLKNLAINSPSALTAIFKLSNIDYHDSDFNVGNSIILSLPAKSPEHNATVLEIIITHAPQSLKDLFSLGNKSNSGNQLYNIIATALTEKTSHEESFLSLIMNKTYFLNDFINWVIEAPISESHNIQSAFINALLKKSTMNDETELQNILKISPHLIHSLRRLVDDSAQGKELEQAINHLLIRTESDTARVARTRANAMRVTQVQQSTSTQTHENTDNITHRKIKIGDRSQTNTNTTSLNNSNSENADNGSSIKAKTIIGKNIIDQPPTVKIGVRDQKHSRRG